MRELLLYLNKIGALILFWYATMSPDRPIEAPAWTMHLATWLREEGQGYAWFLFQQAGVARQDEIYLEYWFEYTWHQIYRRACGRPLPDTTDSKFGWKEMHPRIP